MEIIALPMLTSSTPTVLSFQHPGLPKCVCSHNTPLNNCDILPVPSLI